MIRTVTRPLVACLLLLAPTAPALAGLKPVRHPFILWTGEQIAELRRGVKEDPQVKAAYERMLADDDSRAKAVQELVRFVVTGDEKLAEAQKKQLLRVIKSPIPRGGAQWLTVLRYDLLYDRLSEAERKAFEEMARVYIRNAVFENAVLNPKIFNDSARYSRYDAKKYTRSNWLPNIIWPRKVSANLFAAVLRDEDLIRRTWAHYGSWKWYFDEYLGDLGFYSEEFSKMGSTPGAMLVYCLAVERLGLDELGFGYRGASGATMRGHIEGLLHLGYPRLDLCSDRPQQPMVTMGDLRQMGSSQAYNLPSPAFEHALVVGYLPPDADGKRFGGNLRWRAHGAWGGEVRGNNPQWDGYGGFTPKMQLPLWFELGASRWPEAGFGWFLAQMREPGDAAYVPSLLFGLGPVRPGEVKPPPAPSAVWPQRGFAMLRADESPAYWEGPAPAVCMRLGSNYAHHVNDAFALLGYYALNRPIYLNRQIWPGYASGWSRSVQSHCGATVDYAEPKFTDETAVRQAFTKPVKFVAATSGQVYPGTRLTRALMLTRDYLLDVTDLAGDDEHDYAWIVHALGRLRADEPPIAGNPAPAWQAAELPKKLTPLKLVRGLSAKAQPWRATIDQVCALDDPAAAKLPAGWYERKVGVRIHMLGQPDTAVFAARTPEPLVQKREGKQQVTVEVPSEVGGVTLIATRRARRTTFAAVHEPFERARPRLTRVHALGESSGGLYVAVEGEGFEDRLAISLDGDGECGFAGGGESLRFRDFCYLRRAGETVDVTARELIALKLKVGPARPRLIVNGKPADVRFEGGCLIYGKEQP